LIERSAALGEETRSNTQGTYSSSALKDIKINKDFHTAQPLIIPLSTHGVVDVEGLQIPERELMGHAFMNSISTNEQYNPQNNITE
jgi:hypothetical protein